DEGDLLAVGRPRRATNVARGVELLDREDLHVLDGFALELGGVGDGLLGEGGTRYQQDQDSRQRVSSFEFQVSREARVPNLGMFGTPGVPPPSPSNPCFHGVTKVQTYLANPIWGRPCFMIRLVSGCIH